MNTPSLSERSIFLEAIEKGSAADRSAYLDQACANNPQLRAEVEALLAAHDGLGDLKPASPPPNSPGAGLAGTIDQPVNERLGTVIGPYKLLEQIGEGGMGAVYMAEQQQPVRRKVALKLIKPGMDTRQVIARFEAERQALALMDHVNIARVLDAGATASGQPYFVMELVRGVPITDYCDQNNLAVHERLELFVAVCHAVQHAHQKGIIHRDIKPSNVLVTLYDGRPVPKVIDFGVAKATNQQLTDKTLFTNFAQMIGTPLYMSPEQAEMTGLDVDTRTDIYALGVLLYELLTGTTPFDKERLRAAAYDEIRRIIREEEAAKPSTRISSLVGPNRTAVAAHRHVEPGRLSQLMLGDLDWIAMKALEKDRTRRYDTASNFAADVLRHLSDLPVEACPPSTVYRFRKFARRNGAAIVTAAVVSAALVLGTVVSVWQAVRATQSEGLASRRLVAETEARQSETRQRALADRRRREAERHLTEARRQRLRAEANFGKALAAVDDYLTKVSENQLLEHPGLQPLRRDLLSSALGFYQAFLNERKGDAGLPAAVAAARRRVGKIYAELGDGQQSRGAYRAAMKDYQALLEKKPDDPQLLAGLAECYSQTGASPKAAKVWETLLAASADNPRYMSELAEVYNSQALAKNKPAEALAMHQKSLALREAVVRLQPDDPQAQSGLGSTLNNIGVILGKLGQSEEALVMYLRAAEYQQAAYDGAPHIIQYARFLAQGHNNVASTQWRLRRPSEALRSYEQAVAVWERVARDNPAVAYLQASLLSAYLNLSSIQRELGRAADADRLSALARDVIERMPLSSADDFYNLACLRARCAALVAQGRELSVDEQAQRREQLDRAMDALREAVAKGYRNAAWIQADEDLALLRPRDDFRALAGELEQLAKADLLSEKAKSGTAAARLKPLQEGLAIRQELAARDPRNSTNLAALAATQYAVGLVQLELNQFSEAAESLSGTLATRESLLRGDPRSVHRQSDVAMTYIGLGKLDLKNGKLPEANRAWQQGRRMLETWIAERPQEELLSQSLAGYALSVGASYGQAGLWSKAAEHYALALDQSWRFSLLDLRRAGILFRLVGDTARYRRLCERVVEWLPDPAEGAEVEFGYTLSLGSESGIDPRLAIEALDRWLAVKRTNGWDYYAAALASYRAGEYDQALARLMEEAACDPSRPEQIPLHRLLLSMVQHRLGRQDEAQGTLAAADALFEKYAQRVFDEQPLGMVWWDWAGCLALRREAAALVLGSPAADDPRVQLVEARLHYRLDDREAAEADFQAAVESAPDRGRALVWRAHILDELKLDQRADADLDEAVQVAPDRPHSWIARGRRYAQRGEHEKADADFVKAAPLTQTFSPAARGHGDELELNVFLEAGWWVVGPYPAEMATACAPETAPDPSQKVSPVAVPPSGADARGAKPDEKAEPLAWRYAPTGDYGRVELGPLFESAAQISAYALTYLSSPGEREATLLVGGDDFVRLWLNGRLVHETTQSITRVYGLNRVAVTLRAGRNTLLAKVGNTTGSQTLIVRVADTPFDKSVACAELGLWNEASALLGEQLKRKQALEFEPAVWLAYLYRMSDDQEPYRRQGARLLQEFGHTKIPWEKYVLADALGRGPEGTGDTVRLVELAEKGLTDSPQDPRHLLRLGLARYRHGQFEEALQPLSKAVEADPRFAMAWPLLALAHHRLGHAEQAATWLAKAEEWHEQTVDDALCQNLVNLPLGNWYDWSFFRGLRREAGKAIEGKASADDSRLVALRGCAFARLKEWDQAEAEFAKALELAPNDALVQIAHGRSLAERGEHQRAAEVYAEAARHTPDELDKFFQAGSWLVGPFPEALATAFPPETNPDPASPLPSLAEKSGQAGDTLEWRYVPSGMWRRLDLAKAFNNAEHMSSYALTYVAAPAEQPARLLVGSDGPRRVWLNGQLVHESAAPVGWEFASEKVELALRPGRNTILVKTSHATGAHYLWCRLADSLVDRASDAGEQGRFAEAAALFPSVPERDRDHHYVDGRTALSHLYAGDMPAYREACRRIVERYGATADKGEAFTTVECFAIGGLTYPDAVQWDRLCGLVRKDLNQVWWLRFLAVAEYRAGRNAEALADIRKLPPAFDDWPSWPVIAMCHHRLGDEHEAKHWLKQADEFYERSVTNAVASGTGAVPDGAGWAWGSFLAFYREARALIEDSPPPLDPRLQELQGLAHVRLAAWKWAESDYDKALELAPDEPRYWVARGRCRAALGRRQQADEDFARAAQLSPNDLRPFISSGWWAAGPYPADMALACAPETAPDPSRPVATVPATVTGDETIPTREAAWRHLPADDWGQVDFAPLFEAQAPQSAYALVYVYSAQDRPATLLVSGSGPQRLWLNGQVVHQSDAALNWFFSPGRVSVSLQAGRNTLLLKVGRGPQGQVHSVQFADGPLERGIYLGVLGLWDEAAAEFVPEFDRRPPASGDITIWNLAAALRLANGDREGYRRQCEKMFAQHGANADVWSCYSLAWSCSLAPDGTADAASLVEKAAKSLSELGSGDEVVFVAALAQYRASRFQDAIDAIKGHEGFAPNGYVLAMCHHRLGQADETRRCLQSVQEGYDQFTRDCLAQPAFKLPMLWYDCLRFQIVRREALELIEGQAPAADPNLRAIRGRGFMELEEWAKAIAEFDRALELRPADAQVEALRDQCRARLAK